MINKLFTYSVSLLLSLSLLVLMSGINLSYHACKSGKDTAISFNFYKINSFTSDDKCEYCESDHEDHGCQIPETESASDCCGSMDKAHKTVEANSISETGCCDVISEYIHADLLTNLTQIIDNNVKTSISFVLEHNLKFDILKTITIFEILKHYSGISPPYKSNFIQFIQSILE